MFARKDGLFAPCCNKDGFPATGLPLRPGEVILPTSGVFVDSKERLEPTSLFVCERESILPRDLSNAEGARELGFEFPESEAALILRLLTGIRDVTGGRLDEFGEAITSEFAEP